MSVKLNSVESVERAIERVYEIDRAIREMQSERYDQIRALTQVAMEVCPQALTLNLRKLARFYAGPR